MSDVPPSAPQNSKLKGVLNDSSRSAAARYFDLTYGPMPRWKALLMELVMFCFSGIPGALGLFLRGKLYKPFFGACKGKLLIGRHVTFRHPSKIRFEGNIVLDDRAVLDAKGADNRGITLGDGVFIGRNTIVYCKNGDITLREKVSLSANCIVFSSNSLTMQPGTMVGSFSYLLSGGEYDYNSPVPFADQTGMETVGPLEIGANCWLGAHVTVLDGASIGENCVIAAGSVVCKPIPPRHLARGVPARPSALSGNTVSAS